MNPVESFVTKRDQIVKQIRLIRERVGDLIQEADSLVERSAAAVTASGRRPVASEAGGYGNARKYDHPEERINEMKLRQIVRRSVGLMDDSGQTEEAGEPPARLVEGDLRRVNPAGKSESFTPRAFVTKSRARKRSATSPGKYPNPKMVKRAAQGGRRNADAGGDSGWRVERSGGMHGRPRAVKTPRAAARNSVGLRNSPEPGRLGFTIRDAMQREEAKAQPPASMATRAAPEPAALPGFVDRNGQRWTSRAAYEAMNAPQPEGVPFKA